jgi:signal transduction histidine kinase
MALRLSITTKLIGYLLVASIVPLLAFGISAFQIARGIVIDQAGAYDLRLVSDFATYLRLYRGQVEDLAANVAGNEAIARALSDADQQSAGNYETLNTRAQIGYILNSFGRVKGLVSIDLFTPKGKHFYIGETLNVSDVRPEAVQEMMREGDRSSRSAFWRGVEDNINTAAPQAKVSVVTRLIRYYEPEAGGTSTVGLLLINLSDEVFRDYLSGEVAQNRFRMMVIDRHGRLMHHSNPALIGQPVAPELLERVHDAVVIHQVSLDGEEVIMTTRALPGIDGYLIFATPLALHTAPVNRLATAGLFLLLAGLAGIGVLAGRYSQTVVAPLRAVSDRFSHLSQNPGATHVALPVPAEQDEIATLVRGFNSHIEALAIQRVAASELKHAEQIALESLYTRKRELLANREMEVKNLQLEESSRMKSEFLANMSHELRTPLNAIIGFSEVLKDGLLGDLSAQQQDYVNDIFTSGSHLLSLINDILDLSKVEAGKMTLELEPQRAKVLIQAGLQVVREKASAHRLRLVVDVAEGLGEIWLDQRKVKQILYNLLSNAVKFTPENGEVHVMARRVGGDAFAAGGFAEYLELQVSDTGIGISAEDQLRLFQPFTQIDSTLARLYEGTGLGLVMVKRLAELHGGGVALQSEPGQGSRFTVWLPWRTEADKVAAIPASKSAPGGVVPAAPSIALPQLNA